MRTVTPVHTPDRMRSMTCSLLYGEMKNALLDKTKPLRIYTGGGAASSLKNRDYKDFTDIVQEENMEQDNRKYVLRRLTPMECLRLQGLPDNWCEGVQGSDSAIYKMAGNGLAIPCACDVLGRIAEELNNDH